MPAPGRESPSIEIGEESTLMRFLHLRSLWFLLVG